MLNRRSKIAASVSVECLRRFVGGVVVDLGRGAIKKLVHRRRLAAFERRVDRQRLHRGLDHPLKQPRKVGLEDARQLVLGLQCPPPVGAGTVTGPSRLPVM